jgi:hypothetical protein
MPRACAACSSPERPAIDNALVSSEPYRIIAKRFSISPAALFRHKPHVAQALLRAAQQHGEASDVSLLEETERIRQKAWEILGKLEAEGDHRGSVVALREIRESLETFGNLLSRADGVCLADASDAEILLEAKRRKLRMPVDIRVVYDREPVRNTFGTASGSAPAIPPAPIDGKP